MRIFKRKPGVAPQNEGIVYIDPVTNTVRAKKYSGDVSLEGSGGGAPSGAAGGDLSGTYPNPTIGANKVTSAMLRQGVATSVIGRSANSTGNEADIAASADGDTLRRSGTTLGFGAPVLRETAGPTVLTVGSVTDGQTLRRVGTAIVGYFPLVALAISQSVDSATVLSFASTPANAVTSTGTIGGP